MTVTRAAAKVRVAPSAGSNTAAKASVETRVCVNRSVVTIEREGLPEVVIRATSDGDFFVRIGSTGASMKLTRKQMTVFWDAISPDE